MAEIACSFDSRFGAKPPSSPTAVTRPRFDSSDLRAWNVSLPIRNASANEPAPTGTTMNSWTSMLLSAWTPPLMTFIIGTGSTWASVPPTYR